MTVSSSARSVKPLQTWLSSFVPAASATPDLILIRGIEQTLDSLQAVERLMCAIASGGRKLADELQVAKPEAGKLMDPDDKLVPGLDGMVRAFEEVLPILIRKKASIDNDNELGSQEAELLHISYDRALEAIAEVVEAAKSIRAAVIRHDLIAEGEPAEEFDSVSKLITSLRRA